MIEFGIKRGDITIISGGQTGADRGGLHAARDLGVTTGGWAPSGWKTLLGSEEAELRSLGLKEYHVEGYAPRTERNVLDSECTLIVANSFTSAGTALTIRLCKKHKRPYFLVHAKNLNTQTDIDEILSKSIKDGGFRIINVAGNGEFTLDGPVYKATYLVVTKMIEAFDE